MTAALSHLHVIELCDDIAGAACARQFAAWGADVLVVEPPSGSPLRRLPPLVPDASGEPSSLVWEYLGADKRTETLDLVDESSLARLRGLVARADVFISDRPAAWLRDAALDCASLAAAAPGLVTVSITPFGADGPYAGYAGSDLVVQALSGMLALSGEPGRMPLKVAANVLPQACGVSAFIGALAALHERERSGAGQLVEVATLEAVASLVLFQRAQYFGEPFPRRSGVGTVLLRCADGYVLVSPRALRAWDDLLVALGIEPETVPEPLRSPEGRQEDGALLRFLEEHSGRRPAKDLFHALGTLVVAGYFETPAQLLDDEHLLARAYFRTLDHPRLGALKYPGPAGQMSATPMASPRPAPELRSTAFKSRQMALTPRPPLPILGEGEPNPTEVHQSFPSPSIGRGVASAASRGEGQSDPSSPPLADVRVLDLTTAWIGPYAGMLLADLGADVIKVEGPNRPDTWRFFHAPSGPQFPPPPVARPGAHPGNTRFYYNSVNRNKRGLALDLTDARGKELFLELVRSADIILENFTPRVLENFGLGYDVLRAVNPGIILVSFSGYGRTGPYRNIKATGATIETIAGWVSLFGYPDDGPMLMGEMEADPLSGLQAAAHALVALAHRDRQRGYRGQRPRSEGVGEPSGFPNWRAYRGQRPRSEGVGEPCGEGQLGFPKSRETGQWVDGSMFEAAVGYIGEEILLAGTGVSAPHPRGNRDRAMAPQGAFPCAGDDRWLAITVRDDADWRALLDAATDAPWLRDPHYATAAGRLASVGELEEAVARWTRPHDSRRLMESLQQVGVPAGVILKTDEAPHDPHFVARGWFRPLTHPDTGTQLHNGYPWRFSRSPLVWRSASPRLGEHSDQVLADELHLVADERASLFEHGIVRSVVDWTPEEASAPT